MIKSDSNGLITKYAAHYRKTKKLISNPNAYVLFEYLMDDSLLKAKREYKNLSLTVGKSVITKETGIGPKAIINAYKLLKGYGLITIKSSKNGDRNKYTINHMYYNNLMDCINTLDNDTEEEFCIAFRTNNKSRLKEFGYRELYGSNCELAHTSISAPFITTEIGSNDPCQKCTVAEPKVHTLLENLNQKDDTPPSQKDMGVESKVHTLLEKPSQKDTVAEPKVHTDNNINKENKKNETGSFQKRHENWRLERKRERERNVLSEKEPSLLTGESSDSFSSSDNIDLLPDSNQRSIENQEDVVWEEFMKNKPLSDFDKNKIKYRRSQRIVGIKKDFREYWKIDTRVKFSEMHDDLILLMRSYEIMRIDDYLYSDPELLKHLFPELKEDSNGMWYRADLDI